MGTRQLAALEIPVGLRPPSIAGTVGPLTLMVAESRVDCRTVENLGRALRSPAIALRDGKLG